MRAVPRGNYDHGAASDTGTIWYAVSNDRLEKQGVAMLNSDSEGNIKEATVDRTKAGEWRMFYDMSMPGRRWSGWPWARRPPGRGTMKFSRSRLAPIARTAGISRPARC